MTLSARPLMYKHVKCIYVHSFQKLLICISVAPQEGGNLPKNIGATSKKVVVLGGVHHKMIFPPQGGGEELYTPLGMKEDSLVLP